MVAVPWRSGVNMREFAFYGTSAVPFAPQTLQRQQLQALNDLGVKVVRFFASHRDFTPQQSIDRVRIALAALDEFDMQAIVCLDDGLTGAGYYIKGTESFHNQTQGHYTSDYWLKEEWRKFNLPAARSLATAFKDHPGILMWELGNEFALHPRDGAQRIPNKPASAAFLKFAREVSGAIKEISPSHLISTGLVNSRHVCALEDGEDVNVFSRQLYGLPTIDAISIHYYSHDGERQYAGIELNAAKALDKPFYVGEIGAHNSEAGDRATYYRNEINEWKNAGAFTVLPWAFDSSDRDVGVSDLYAFARIHGDYDRLRDVSRGFGGAVRRFMLIVTQPKPTPDPAPAPPPVEKVEPVGTGGTASGRSPAGGTASGASPIPVADALPALIRLQYPMKWAYKVTARFDDPTDYTGNVLKKREGMMFVPDTPARPLEVLASQRGVVSKVASYPPGYGNYVCIRHNWNGDNFVTWYAHLERSTVREGQFVNAGDVIGFAGDSGSADVTCLFFTVQHLDKGKRGYVVDYVIDPALLLDPITPALEESQFGADVTIPDGTIFTPGAFFKKIWQVRNTGTTTWGAGYTLAFFADNPMGAGASVPIPVTKPGESVQVAVDLVAPPSPGTYQSTWKLKNAAGQFFGEILYTAVEVKAKTDEVAKLSIARFSADVTIPDRTPVKPGSKFTKTWRILNDGETTWGDGYSLVFVKDDRMGAVDSVPLPAIRRGRTGEVSVEFTAPKTAGIHRSTWKPRDPQGNFFDFEMYVEINVDPKAGEPGKLNPIEIFPAPVSGLKGREYYIGLRFLDYIEYLADHQHKGVDYLSYNRAVGLPILAAADGVVAESLICDPCTAALPNFNAHGLSPAQRSDAFNKLAPWNYGFGNLVIVRYEWNAISASGRRAILNLGYPDKGATAYVLHAHLLQNLVQKGDRVAAGTQIGTLGDSGNSTAPHLHLEIRVLPAGDTRYFTKSAYKLLNPLLMYSE